MSQQDKHSILSRESEVDIIRKVMLTMNEQKKYEVIKKLVDTNGNKDRAAIELGSQDVLSTDSSKHIVNVEKQPFPMATKAELLHIPDLTISDSRYSCFTKTSILIRISAILLNSLKKMTVSLSLRVPHALSSQQIMNSHIPKKMSLDLDFLLFASNMLLFGFPFCKNKHQDGKFFVIYLHDKKWQFPGNKFLRHFGNYNMYCIRIFNYFPLCSSHIASKKSNMGIHDPKLPQIGSSNPQIFKPAGPPLLIQQPLP